GREQGGARRGHARPAKGFLHGLSRLVRSAGRRRRGRSHAGAMADRRRSEARRPDAVARAHSGRSARPAERTATPERTASPTRIGRYPPHAAYATPMLTGATARARVDHTESAPAMEP